MPTKKKRINVTLKKDIAIYLKMIALRDDVPEATKAAELIELAMEANEEDYFIAISEKRDTPGAKYYSHQRAWK